MPVVSTNIAALDSLRYTNINTQAQSTYLSELSSGSRVPSAADDAASLAIGTKLQSDAASLGQASTNASNASALLNTADGGAAQIGDILQRLKVLATEAQSGTVDTGSLTDINDEFSSLITEIGTIATATKFNGQSLIASGGSTSTFLLGLSSSDTVVATLTGADASTLGVASVSVTSAAAASTASASIDTAITTLSGLRATIGADLSRVQYQQNYVNTAQENSAAGASNLLDADVAQVETEFNNSQVLTESGIAAIQKANSIPQELLTLLKS